MLIENVVHLSLEYQDVIRFNVQSVKNVCVLSALHKQWCHTIHQVKHMLIWIRSTEAVFDVY